MITRRRFLASCGAFLAGSLGLTGYAFGVEPMLACQLARYRLAPAGWPPGLALRIAVIADLHACEPGMPPERIARIVEATNALGADLVVLLGDYVAGHAWVTRKLAPAEWSRPLGRLRAPLGVHAILGNHDWWDDRDAQKAGHGPVVGRRALEDAGIGVLENDALRLIKDGQPLWLLGLADQLALLPRKRYGRDRFVGLDDLPATLAKVTDDAPAILLAHEPDIFPRVPGRVALTLSGHTHGGQIRLLGYSPVVPSRYGNRYAYGLCSEAGRHLVVSGGLGCSVAPVRLGMPPEIGLIEIGVPA